MNRAFIGSGLTIVKIRSQEWEKWAYGLTNARSSFFPFVRTITTNVNTGQWGQPAR